MQYTMSNHQRLRDMKVSDLMIEKKRLVEVPYSATLAHTMSTLVANRVVAVPVAAPPGHWIGAGGSMILESDKQTGVVRKHYIGMVTMLDVLAHIAGGDEHYCTAGSDIDRKMAVPVSSIIGHCLESLSLWTLNPNTSIIDCMEVFSKGIHRALVPVDSHIENTSGVELVESASSYRMVSQMDVLRFIKEHSSELDGLLSRPVGEMRGVTDDVFAVTSRSTVMSVIKSMRSASLHAVPIVESFDYDSKDDHTQLLYGNGRKLVGTFSATDLRACPVSQLQEWLNLTVMEFTEKVSENPLNECPDLVLSPRELITCYAETSLLEVIDQAVDKHIHRVWVVDHSGLLSGIVSLTDMIRVTRVSLLSEDPVV